VGGSLFLSGSGVKDWSKCKVRGTVYI